MKNRLYRIEVSQVVPLPRALAFAFFADAFNLEAITPPWLRFRIITDHPIAMREDALIDYRLTLHQLPIRWRTRIATWEPDQLFVDTQVAGPFRFWEHTHTFATTGGGTMIRDVVRYRLPFGPLGAVAHRALVRGDLERIFRFRREAIERLLVEPGRPAVRPAGLARRDTA